MSSILIVDDDRAVRHLIRQALADFSVEVAEAGTAEEGLDLVRAHSYDVVLLDIGLPEMSGLEAFRACHALDPKLPVIFITAMDSADVAIQAMTLGAYDFVMKPFDVPALGKLIMQAVEVRRLMNVPVSVPGAAAKNDVGDRLVGRSAAMQDVYKAVGRVAPQNVTVLIRGESGTGKELVARAIYQHSPRSDRPFLGRQLRGNPGRALGKRTVRPREGGLHRGRAAPHRQIRAMPRRERYSLMRSATCRCCCRPRCCACCNSNSLNASAAIKRLPPTCA